MYRHLAIFQTIIHVLITSYVIYSFRTLTAWQVESSEAPQLHSPRETQRKNSSRTRLLITWHKALNSKLLVNWRELSEHPKELLSRLQSSCQTIAVKNTCKLHFIFLSTRKDIFNPYRYGNSWWRDDYDDDGNIVQQCRRYSLDLQRILHSFIRNTSRHLFSFSSYPCHFDWKYSLE